MNRTLETAAAPAACQHSHRRQIYQFPGQAPACVVCAARHPPVFRRAVRIALVVGTILTCINQGDILLQGKVALLVLAKIGLTFLVPFSVSTYSALGANRIRSIEES